MRRVWVLGALLGGLAVGAWLVTALYLLSGEDDL